MTHKNVLEMIGNSPIVKLNKVVPNIGVEFYAKVEYTNPGGSIKDRAALSMVEDAEKSGALKPGGTIIEATSGNTGMGLAIAAAVKGYKAIFVMPDKMSREKIKTLRAFGAEVVVTPTNVEPDDARSYYSVARKLNQDTPNSVYMNQYDNPANPAAHVRSTGPEILKQMPDVHAIIAGIGTGGTTCGLGRFFKENKSPVKVIAVDPIGSIVFDKFKQYKFKTGNPNPIAKGYKVEGIGEDIIPKNYNFDVIDDVVQSGDQEAMLMCRDLLQKEGLWVGPSSGSALVGAIKYAKENQASLQGKKLLVIFPESGNRYLSKVFDDEWMMQNGFIDFSDTQGAPSFGTLAIHAGQPADKTTGAVMTPIYQTSTYAQKSPGEHTGYEYSRTDNPTRTAYQECVAALENAKHGLAFSSGLAAIDSILHLLKPGDHVLCCDDVYGGTYRILEKVYKSIGIEVSFVDLGNLEKAKAAFKPNTKMLWLESPTNPLLKVLDIAGLCKIAREKKAISVVDNTFLSPYFQKPLTMGADLVVHSVTKYMNGHSDVIGGVIALNDKDLYERLKFYQNAIGAVPGPMDCFLVMRGLKTLHVRMERHQENAKAIVAYLGNHPKVEKVLYPGMGGMVSFYLKSDLKGSKKFLESLKLFTLAESLGGVESLIEHPAIMTHASIPAENRTKLGILDNLIRVSVGLEDAKDLISDLKHSLSQV